MHRLLERVERDQPQPGLQGGVHRAGGALGGEQPGERLQGQLAQALPLGHQPLLERWLLQGEPIEQVAAIELDRLPKRLRRPLAHQPFEGHRVDVDGLRVQGDGRSLDA